MSTQTSIEWAETDLAYLAGLVDGEGSIYATTNSRHGGTVYPVVIVAMTHYDVLVWVAEKLGTAPPHEHNVTNRREHPDLRTQWAVSVTGRRAQDLCRALLPFLKVKWLQASLIADYPVDARCGPGRGIPLKVRTTRSLLFAELAELNRRRRWPGEVLGPDGRWYDPDPGGLSAFGNDEEIVADMIAELWGGRAYQP